jgi:hypothetical protein
VPINHCEFVSICKVGPLQAIGIGLKNPLNSSNN